MAKSLLRSTALVSSMTFISRVLGFLRDMVLAQVFGAVAGFDAFLVAFRIPNFLRRLFGEGAFSQAFVPVLSEYRQLHNEEEIKLFIDRVAGALTLVLVILTVLFMLLTPLLVTIFAPGFIGDPLRFDLAASMLQITSPYLLLIALTAFCAGILNSYGSFGIPAFAPVLFNVNLIFAALVLRHYFAVPVTALAWGEAIGGIIQLIFQLPYLAKKNLLPKPRLSFRDPGVRKILKLMLPAIFGVSVAQISVLIDTLFASFLPVGSLSWLYYSERLVYFPLGIIGVALATVVLPHLSRKHTGKDPLAFSKTLDWAMRMALIIGLPAAIGLFMLAGPLLASLFHYGKFDIHDVEMTRLSLMAYAVGLPGFMLVKIFASGYYSQQNISKPVQIAVIALVVNMLLNVALIFPLKHTGLALATSLAATLNALLLLTGLLRSKAFRFQPGWPMYLLRLLVANAAVIILLELLCPRLSVWLNWNALDRNSYLALCVSLAALIYFFILVLSGLRLKHFRSDAV